MRRCVKGRVFVGPGGRCHPVSQQSGRGEAGRVALELCQWRWELSGADWAGARGA